MCNCIAECEENLKEHLLKTYDKVNHCMIVSTWLKGPRKVIMKANVMFTVTQKNGKVVEREKELSVTSSYCPFCGERYPEE